jgi:hypothetical protein
MSERKQVTIWLSEGQLEDWDNYQEELGFDSRAGLIRRAVESSYQQQEGEATQEHLGGELRAEIEDLQQKIDLTRSEITDVRKEQISQDNIQSFAQETSHYLGQQLDGQGVSFSNIMGDLRSRGKYIRIDSDSILRKEEPEFENADVMAIDDLEAEPEALKDALKNAYEEADDAEEIFGLEILSGEEAVAHGI